MEKLAAHYPNLRSSTRKFDPCVQNNPSLEPCKKCRVYVMSDRFLGEEAQKKLVGSIRKFPYVLIVDTIGCNLRCWFCYSHHFWTVNIAENKGCEPVWLSPENIVEQINCKIEQIIKAGNYMEHKPFTEIRVSGGEPVYADKSTLRPYASDQRIDYKLGVNYWLEFFEKLNDLIEKLKDSRKINVVGENSWDTKRDWPFPTFVSDVPNRVGIRFDTNGIAFGNNEEARRVSSNGTLAEYFTDGIFKLHKERKLNNLKIWITYSFKGATPAEYYWSQRKKLPTSPQNNPASYVEEEHPQISGYKNLQSKIDKYTKLDQSFRDAVEITIEKGINHDPEHKVYLYNPEAFDWKLLSTKLGKELSEVKNDICIVYTYGEGPWGLRKVTPGLIKRYFNQGAELVIETKDKVYAFKGTYAQAREAVEIMARHNEEDVFKIILRPSTEQFPLETIQKRVDMSDAQPSKEYVQSSPEGGKRAWILTGNKDNWMIALDHKKWGVRKKYEETWQKVQPKDLLIFYVTKPISGIVGFGEVVDKQVEDSLLWPEEKAKAIYPLRVTFKAKHLLALDEWETNKLKISNPNIIYYGGLNFCKYTDATELVREASRKWSQEINLA